MTKNNAYSMWNADVFIDDLKQSCYLVHNWYNCVKRLICTISKGLRPTFFYSRMEVA
jgi:hypothetical protein